MAGQKYDLSKWRYARIGVYNNAVGLFQVPSCY